MNRRIAYSVLAIASLMSTVLMGALTAASAADLAVNTGRISTAPVKAALRYRTPGNPEGMHGFEGVVGALNGNTAGHFVGLHASATRICVGDTAVIDVSTTDMSNLDSFEFAIHYPADGFVMSGALANPLFDTATGSQVALHGAPSAGVVAFAASKAGPSMLVNAGGDGAIAGDIAKVKLTARKAGVHDVTLVDVMLRDRHGHNIDAMVRPAKVTVEVCGFTSISGKVRLQGRTASPSAGISSSTTGIVTLAIAGHELYNAAIARDGAFIIDNIKVAPGGTTYTINASHGVYLTNQTEQFLMPLVSPILPDTVLKGGDANNSGVVELGDIACIGGAYGGAPTACGTGSSDINSDGLVNILDLTLVAGNYGLSAPHGWR